VAGKVHSQGAFTAPLSLWRFPLLGLGIVFTIFPDYINTNAKKVNNFLQD
jgi:hypothetical protein